MMKFDVRNFNYRNDFNIQHIKMRALLVQRSLFKTLKGIDNFSKGIDDEEKEDLTRQLHGVIQLYSSGEILREVVKETIVIELQIKLETLYMTKFLTN